MEIGRYELLRFILYNSYSVLLTYYLTSKMALHKIREVFKKKTVLPYNNFFWVAKASMGSEPTYRRGFTITFSNTTLSNIKLSNTTLNNTTLSNTTLSNSTLSNIKLSNTTISNSPLDE